MTLKVGDQVRLRPEVSFGPLIPLRITRVFQNGMAEARNEENTTWIKARHIDFQPESTLSPNFMAEYREYLELKWAKEEAEVDGLKPSDFSDDYKIDLVQAYPEISQTPYRGNPHPFFTGSQLEDCFIRVLAAKNLRKVHELYLEGLWTR